MGRRVTMFCAVLITLIHPRRLTVPSDLPSALPPAVNPAATNHHRQSPELELIRFRQPGSHMNSIAVGQHSYRVRVQNTATGGFPRTCHSPMVRQQAPESQHTLWDIYCLAIPMAILSFVT